MSTFWSSDFSKVILSFAPAKEINFIIGGFRAAIVVAIIVIINDTKENSSSSSVKVEVQTIYIYI